MDGYKIFKKDTQGRSAVVAQNIKECFGYQTFEDVDERVKYLWVRVRGKADKPDIVVGVPHRPPNLDEKTDEICNIAAGRSLVITSPCSC